MEDLVSRLRMGITRLTIWVIGVLNLLTEYPDPPSSASQRVHPSPEVAAFRA